MPLARAFPSNGSSGFSTHTILLVEDEVLIRITLADFLRDSGYRVLEAADVAEAKAMLNAGTPVDLVFSDVSMPGEENGFALAKWLRAHHPRIVVLLTSGFADRAGDRPADISVLDKPYTYDVVLQEIQRLFRNAES